jgi:hypothetical protein
MAFLHTKDYEGAAASLGVAAEARPDNWRVHYEMACTYALGKQKKKAIEALKKAVEKGLSDGVEIERNPRLDSIRQEAEYRKLVEGLKKSGESGQSGEFGIFTFLNRAS